MAEKVAPRRWKRSERSPRRVRKLWACSGRRVPWGAGCARTAQTFPDRPIKIIAPFTPGSPNDVVARLIAPPMAAKLGQSVVIDNRPGGGTAIGVKATMTAEPDGYTLMISNSPTHFIAPLVNKTFTYDPLKDFVPDRHCRQRRADAGDRAGGAGQDAAGVRRLRQSQSGQAQLRLRPGHAAATGRRDVQARERHRHRQHPLQGRHPGRYRHAGRPGADEHRHHLDAGAARPRGQAPRARHHQRGRAMPNCRTCRPWRRAGCRRSLR